MITMQRALDEAMEIAMTPKADLQPADNEHVAERLRQMAKAGYRPSPEAFAAVRDYLTGYGLLLTGEAGVGKTMLIRCLNIRIYMAENIIEYGLSRMSGWYDWTDGHEICIDDFGAERIVAEYGAKDEVLRAVIVHRSDRQSARTHVTTNLTAEQISERYGDRVLSRLLGMCKAHTIKGHNQRVAVPYSKHATLSTAEDGL